MTEALHIHDLERTIDETVPSVHTVTFPVIEKEKYGEKFITDLGVTLLVVKTDGNTCLEVTANSSGSVVVLVEEEYHSLPEEDKDHLAYLVGQYILIGERDSK